MVPLLAAGLALAAAAVLAVAAARRRLVSLRRVLVEAIPALAPEMTVAEGAGPGLRVRVLGAEVEVDVASLARQGPRPGGEAAWAAEVVRGIRAHVPTPGVPPFALVADRLLPLVKPRAFAALFDQYPGTHRLVARPLGVDLAVTYVVAGTHHHTAVTAHALQTWGLDPEALHARALENLRAQTRHLLDELGARRRRYESLDAYDATRLLVGDLLTPPDVGDPVFAIPEETTLWIAPAAEGDSLAADAEARYRRASRPLTPILFRIGPDGPVPLAAEPHRSR